MHLPPVAFSVCTEPGPAAPDWLTTTVAWLPDLMPTSPPHPLPLLSSLQPIRSPRAREIQTPPLRSPSRRRLGRRRRRGGSHGGVVLGRPSQAGERRTPRALSLFPRKAVVTSCRYLFPRDLALARRLLDTMGVGGDTRTDDPCPPTR